MLTDVRLYGWLAVAVILVGSFLWFRPRKRIKPSGVGDIGQYKK